jgi:hypothetical protein
LPKRIRTCIVDLMWVGLVLAATVVSLAGAYSPLPDERSCPDPGEVEARLAQLGVERGMRPEITVVSDQMHIVLHRHDGLTLGSRTVDAPTSCHERATVAAVMVATWMGVWPAGTKPAAPTAPAGPTAASATTLSQPSPLARKQGTALGLAVTSSWDGQAFAAGLAVEARWPLAGPLRGFVALSATTEREMAVEPGRAGYLRPALEAGPSLRLGAGSVQGELLLSGKLGLLVLRGKDLPITHVATRAVPGLAAALRVVFVSKTLSPFLSVGSTFWLSRERATLDDDRASAELPRWDATLGLGALLGGGA